MAYTFDTMYEEVAADTVVTFAFNHNGNPFRIVMYKHGAYRARMTAYTGANGLLTHKNKVEDKWSVYCQRHTLRQCIEVAAARAFDIKPTDIVIIQ